MAQYGGEQYMKQEGHHQNNEYANNPLQSSTVGHETGATETTTDSNTAGHGIGGTGTGAGHGYEEGKHGGMATGTTTHMKQEGQHQNNEYANNPLQSSTVGHETGATGTTTQSNTAGHGIGGTGTTIGTGAGHGCEEGKHGGTGGILHRSGSGSSSSSEDDREGGRRKKKGVVEKIKEKLPGGDQGGDEHKTSATHATVGGGAGGGYGNEGEEGVEKKGLLGKINVGNYTFELIKTKKNETTRFELIKTKKNETTRT